MDPIILNDNGRRPLEAMLEEEEERLTVHFVENDLSGLKRCWEDMSKKEQERFQQKYGPIDALIEFAVDEGAIRAFLRYFDPGSRCFVLPHLDLAFTLEEYYYLLTHSWLVPGEMYVPKLSEAKSDIKKVKEDLEKRFGVRNSWARDTVTEPRDGILIDWPRIFHHMEDVTKRDKKVEWRGDASWKRIDFLALGIYGLVLFPTTQNRVHAGTMDLILKGNDYHKRGSIMIVVLAETIRSCIYIKQNKKGQLRCCTQLFTLWIHYHIFAKEGVKYGTFMNSGIDFVKPFNKPNRKEMEEDEWVDWLADLEVRKVKWRAPGWIRTDQYLPPPWKDNCIPLFGLFGAVSYSPEMVKMQLGHEQGVPELGGVDDWNFDYDRRVQTIHKIDVLLEIWSRCKRKTIRLGEGFTEKHQTWRKEWVKGKVMPKKPRYSLRRRCLEAEKTVKEKELEIVDLQVKNRDLEHQLDGKKRTAEELVRIKEENERLKKEAYDAKRKMAKAEADAGYRRQWSAHDLQERRLAEAGLRLGEEKHELESRRQEAELNQLKKDLKVRDQVMKEQRGKETKHLVERQQLEAENLKLRKEKHLYKDKAKGLEEATAMAWRERSGLEEKLAQSVGQETEYKGILDNLRFVNITQELRRKACSENKAGVVGLESLTSLIDQNPEIQAILNQQKWLVHYVNQLKGDLDGIAVRARQDHDLGLSDSWKHWVEAEESIDKLHKASMGDAI